MPYLLAFLMMAGVILFFVTGGITLNHIDENRDTTKDRRVMPPEDYK